MRKRCALSLLLSGILCLPVAAPAKAPKPEALAKAMQLVQAERGFSRWVRYTPEGYAAFWGLGFPAALDPALRARLETASAEVQAIFRPVSDQVDAKLMARYITEGDMEAVLSFASSPAGRARRAAMEAAEYRVDLSRAGALRLQPDMREAVAAKARAVGLVVPKEWQDVPD